MRPESGAVVKFVEGKIQVLCDNQEDFIATISSDMARSQIKRASYVYPTNALKRIAFKLIRGLFGDKGRLANWTRKWTGNWLADMKPFNGPVLGPYSSRTAAIESEKTWLWDNVGI